MIRSSRWRRFRIDTPSLSGDTYNYFFIDPVRDPEYDPWWGNLVLFLEGLEPKVEWGGTEEGDTLLRVVHLDVGQRSALLSNLESAPEQQCREHRGLRHAIRLLNLTDKPARVVYFCAPETRPGRHAGETHGQ